MTNYNAKELAHCFRSLAEVLEHAHEHDATKVEKMLHFFNDDPVLQMIIPVVNAIAPLSHD